MHRFMLCDLVTGRFLTDLPLSAGDSIKSLIARVDSQSFTLPVMDDGCPDDWADLLVDGKTMIVLVLDGVPAQGWTVDDHEFGDVSIPITGSTLETCLARTNVPDLDSGLDMSQAASRVVDELRPRFGFDIEYALFGKTSEVEYRNAEDQSMLDALTAMQKAGGPEWRIVLRWTDATHRAVDKILEIRPRIGVNRPDAVFDLATNGKGVIESYRRRPSFAAGKGATMLIGTSDGSGSERPMTEPMFSSLIGAGFPVWEERKNFTGLGQGDVDEDTELNTRTTALLTQRQHGTTTWQIIGNDLAPRPGSGYDHGDTVHVDVAPQGKRDPFGGKAAIRALGWDLNLISGRAELVAWEDEDDNSNG